jgi:uncharacterized SAM-binding protein YcdF (DUF218 family)
VDCSSLGCSWLESSRCCRANKSSSDQRTKKGRRLGDRPFFFSLASGLPYNDRRNSSAIPRLRLSWRILLSLLPVVLFYPFTLTALANFLTFSQSPEPSDLILVLGGDFWGPRVLTGAELGARGYAPRVLISGPPYRNQPESELAIAFLEEKGYRKDLFTSFPNYAKSTIEEAVAVCPELKRLGASRVLIVTTAYHSRRANLVLRLFCPGIRFRSIAAPDDQFQPESWWKTPRYRQIFFAEWEKIMATVFWEYPRHKLTLHWRAV